MMKATVFAAAVAAASATTFIDEKFDGDYTSRFTVPSKWKDASELGSFTHTAGKTPGNADNKGIQTTTDARFHGIIGKLDTPFVSTDKTLVLQYSVKNEQTLGCGGAYIKLLGGDVDVDSFGGDTPYAVMFGPDKCGYNSRTHVIFTNKKGENLLVEREPRMETNQLTNFYTLIVKPDNTYEVRINNEEVQTGSLYDDFQFLEPKQIKDPEQSKPTDWVDNAMMDDPNDVKPEGYDDIPETIPEAGAEQPEDWDEEEDGEWEPPMVPNPEFKGPWKAAQIENPDYKGEWEHPLIDNPDFVDDKTVYDVCADGCSHVGFELWQVEAGTIFDNILVTDTVEEAEAAFEAAKEELAAEKAASEAAAEAERIAAEEAAAAAAAEEEEADEDWEEEADEDKEEL
jgi:calreticulin